MPQDEISFVVAPASPGTRKDAIRRAIDVTGAVAGLVVASPVLLAAAVAIRLEDSGSVIYRRRVLARGGGEFDAYKLRTMRPEADGDADADEEDHRADVDGTLADFSRPPEARLTRVGRFLRRYSIDELPQLINVLRGQMALVGPRMMNPIELPRYGELGPRLLELRPGITGLWQVSGRKDLDFARRMALDREYLERRSLWLDISILLRTVPVVLGGRGAY
jgi:lipopolysaccharide/colanic/teichoic acid biosynthesis glycosyltransferase